MRWYSSGPRNWTDTLERPKARKMDMRSGTWNVRSFYRSGSLKTVSGMMGGACGTHGGGEGCIQHFGWEA
jgi:hypothetical protein